MLWRFKSLLLYTTHAYRLLTAKAKAKFFFRSVHDRIPSSKVQELFAIENLDDPCEHFSYNRTKPIVLTHDIVHSTLKNCPSDLVSLCFFIWCAKQPGYFHDARSVDHMVGVVDSLTRHCMTVRGVVDELKRVGCVMKAQTFLLLLRVYWRGGMYEMVVDIFEEMDRAGFMPNTFARNVVMDVLFKSGNVDSGIRVLKETPLPNILSFKIALCNLCKLNDAASVKEVLRIMLKNGVYPNVETFEIVLNYFCKLGQMAEVYQVLGVITALGISLSVISWSILIAGFCRLSRLDMAGYLLDRMIESGCSPNVVTFTSLIKGSMETKMESHAFLILEIMESKGLAPDLVLYNVLIDCLSKTGRYDEALDFFVGLSKRKLVPDSYTFSSLLSTLCLSESFALSPKLDGRLLVEMDLNLVVYNSLLHYFCKAGFPTHAVELYNYMVDQGFTPDNYSFVGLLNGLCGAKRFDEAVNVYQGIIMIYPALDAHVHTVIMDQLIRVGKYHTAIRLFRRAIVGKYPLDVVSYTVALRGLLKSGRIGEASTLYSQMKEIGLSPNVHTYKVMLIGFCKERDIKMVQQLLQEIIEAGIKLERGTLIRVASFVFKYHPSSSTSSLLIEMRNLGLIPKEVMCHRYLMKFILA